MTMDPNRSASANGESEDEEPGRPTEEGSTEQEQIEQGQTEQGPSEQGPTEEGPSEEDLRQFVYGLSHDLKQPLSIIRGNLDLLEGSLEDQLDADSQEYLEAAIDGVERTEALLEDLLTYVRVGHGEAATEAVDLNEVLEDVVSNLGHRLDDPNASVTVESLPPVRGNRTQLLQLFQNLVSNGLKYQDEPPFRVRVVAEPTDEGYRLTVEDNGVGIPEDERGSIFQAFERGSGSLDVSGSGLGLTLCERIVDTLDGRIEIESTPGEGTAVHVVLPADRVEGRPGEAPAEDSNGAAEGDISVVLIDDVAGIRSLMSSILEETGDYEVIGEASSGEEGIEVARETEPDLVLLDLSMPRMDGLEALPRIREVTPESEVVIYSGFQEKEMAAAAKERGAVGYIEKGGKPDEIVAELDGLLAG